MRNIAFVAWMLGWPWLLSAYPGDTPPSDTTVIGAALIWVSVAIITYERKDTTK